MDQKPSWRQKLAYMPLPVYFLYSSVSFGALTGLQHRFIDHRQHNVLSTAIFEGLFFGIFMTLFAARARRQLAKTITGDNPMRQRILLQQAIKTEVLPTDKTLRENLKAYIDHSLKSNRRIRKIGPIEFGLFVLLSIYLLISTRSYVWLAYMIGFAGFAIYTHVQPTKTIAKLERLALQLETNKTSS